MSVRELTKRADVGRSTFYEHFEGKEDLLELSIARPLGLLADASIHGASSGALLEVLNHMRAERVLALALLQGERSVLVRVLARKLEGLLAARVRHDSAPPIAPLPFLAASLAHAQLGVIDAWLSADDACDVHAAARVLQATTCAGLAAVCSQTSLHQARSRFPAVEKPPVVEARGRASALRAEHPQNASGRREIP